MLLRGMFSFEPRPEDHNHTLPFTCNDKLIFLEVLKRDSNWIKVADIYGRVGYVPKTFVEPDENCQIRDLVLTFLVDAIVKARQNGLPSAPPLETLRDEIREHPSVFQHRTEKMLHVFRDRYEEDIEVKTRRSKSDNRVNRVSHQSHHRLPSDHLLYIPRPSSSVDLEAEAEIHPRPKPQLLREEEQRFRNDVEVQYHSDPSLRTALEGTDSDEKWEKKWNQKTKPVVSSPSFQRIKTNLISVVQETSGLDPRLSENLLNEVFQRIKESSVALPVESFLEKLSLPTVAAACDYDDNLSELTRIMKSLSTLSKDGIKQHDSRKRKVQLPSQTELDKLRKLLIECDPLLVTKKLEVGQHSFSQEFVHLYHLENPVTVKERMLDIFLIICSLDKKGRALLLSSKLPIYLSRELMAVNAENKIFERVVDLLTTLLSSGETMPDSHFQILGSGFTNYLLREVEDTFSKSDENEYDKISGPFSALVRLILAYNLQFSQDVKENIVLKVIGERWKRPRGFVTVIIELFQKASDPLQVERDNDFNRSVPHSVFKMVADLCLCQRTASSFTVEDRATLKNSIIEGLCDNPAGSIRLGYLQVLRALLEHVQQNLKDVRTALLSVLLETDPLAIPEQQMIRQMSKEYPVLFLNTISRIKANVDTEGEFNSRGEINDNGSYLSS